MLAELQTKLAGLANGAIQSLRGERSGALVVADAHARYQEAVMQGNVFGLATAVAGVTVAAANVIGAANAQPLVGVFNPPGSGKNVVILFGRHVWNSGTAAAGGLVWGTFGSPAGVTAANGTNPTNMLSQKAVGSAVQGYVNQAMTGVGTTVAVAFSGGPTVGALAANASVSFFDDISGSIIIPPGAVGGLFAAAAGTSPIVSASMVWEEVPA